MQFQTAEEYKADVGISNLSPNGAEWGDASDNSGVSIDSEIDAEQEKRFKTRVDSQAAWRLQLEKQQQEADEAMQQLLGKSRFNASVHATPCFAALLLQSWLAFGCINVPVLSLRHQLR